MGSWDLACHLTHVPIGEGEPAYFFPIMPCFPNVGSSLNDAGWAFAGPPIKGVYDGYGSLDGIDEASIGAKWLRAVVDDHGIELKELLREMAMPRSSDARPLNYVSVNAGVYEAAKSAKTFIDLTEPTAQAPWPMNLPRSSDVIAATYAEIDADPDLDNDQKRARKMSAQMHFGHGATATHFDEFQVAEQALTAHYPLHGFRFDYGMRIMPKEEPGRYAKAFENAAVRCADLVDEDLIAETFRMNHIFEAVGTSLAPSKGIAEVFANHPISAAMLTAAVDALARWNDVDGYGPEDVDDINVADSWTHLEALQETVVEIGHENLTLRDAAGRISVWDGSKWLVSNPADGTAPWVCIN